MHEFGLVMEMVALAESELQRAGCVACETRIKQLNLTVGKLSGASPEAMRTAFTVISRSKGWSGAELVISEPCAECICHTCGLRREISELVFECPDCGNLICEIKGGQELQLTSIDVED